MSRNVSKKWMRNKVLKNHDLAEIYNRYFYSLSNDVCLYDIIVTNKQ